MWSRFCPPGPPRVPGGDAARRLAGLGRALAEAAARRAEAPRQAQPCRPGAPEPGSRQDAPLPSGFVGSEAAASAPPPRGARPRVAVGTAKPAAETRERRRVPQATGHVGSLQGPGWQEAWFLPRDPPRNSGSLAPLPATAARSKVRPSEEVTRDGPRGRWHKVPSGWRVWAQSSKILRKARRQQDHVSGAAKLELEQEFRGAGAAAAGQRLLQTEGPARKETEALEASGRSSRAASALRWFTTVIVYAAFLGLGTTIAILGPTFQDLARNVNRNISSLSEIFVGRAFGYLGGSVLGGILFDCMNHFLLLGVSLVATTVGLYLIPFCKTAVLLIVVMSVIGVSFGILDTGGNVLILAIWGDEGAPHMQALHFSFALGAFLAPLLAKLALGTTVSAENHTEPDFQPPATNGSSEADSAPLFGLPDDMNLLWAYAFTGTYVFIVSVFLFALFFKKSSRKEKSKASVQESRRAEYHKSLLCLLFLFFFFYVGAEVTYGSYVFSFATTHAGMEEQEAAGLNSIFWGTFAACRGLAIFFATCLQPGTMIVLSNIGSLASSLFLVLFSKSPLCLWIATSVYGASMAATFPSGVSWIEQYTTINGKSAAFILIGGALGQMAIPAIVGVVQGQYLDLPVVLYSCLGSAIFTAVLFPVMYKLATLPLDRQRKEDIKSKKQKALLLHIQSPRI